jgi:hypothetical protein
MEDFNLAKLELRYRGEVSFSHLIASDGPIRPSDLP